ncbi:MAG: hypothetical protein H6840_00170 [Planctomycetes bacterium]|nr:hypothetical protein [Planctomycetota bacterium]
MSRLACAALAAVALLLLAAPRPAHADPNFGITPEKKLAKALADLADTCFECGDIAKQKGLYTYARSFFSHALEYDTDHKKTRKVMGFERKKGTWVLEEDMVPLTDKINEAKRDELTEKLRLDTTPVREKAAEALWKFVEDTDLTANQRLLALWHVVQICPEHRGAQKAARSAPAYQWFKHTLDDDAETNRQVWIQRAPEGEVLEERTPYEEQSGLPMAKRRSDWLIFHMDIGEKGPDWAKSLLQYGEACRTHVFELLATEPPKPPEKDEHRLHYTVMVDRDRYARFVEKCSGITDAAHRKEAATVGWGTPTYNPYGSVWLYPRLDNDYGLRDGIAHDLASKEIFRFCGTEGAYWLARGLGYLSSTHMNGSTQGTFYAVKTTGVIDSGGRESLPGLGNCAAGWRLRVAMEITGGTELKPGELARLRVVDFSQREMAHAFCYTDFLVNQHRAGLSEFLKACYDERARRYKEKQDPETATEILARLYKTLETTEEDFMAAFRTWALANYVALPIQEEK